MSDLNEPDTQQPTKPANGAAKPARTVRVGTIVRGLVVIAIAAIALATRLSGAHVSPMTFLLWVLLGVGAVLVISGITAASRNRAN